MMEFTDFPPCPYFMQTLRHCPDAALLYCKIWEMKNNQYKLAIRKENLFNIFLISHTKFRNRLVKLMEEGLLSFDSTPEFYYIELVAFGDLNDDQDDDHNDNSDDSYEFS